MTSVIGDPATGPTTFVDDADLADVAGALTRLLPSLEQYVRGLAADSFPAYETGGVPSEPMALPAEGVGLEATIDELGRAVEEGCRISAPGWWGFVTTGATTAGVVAQTAVALAGGQRYLLHAFNALERTGLRWLAELCGLPEGVAGVFSSGGSTANLVALGAARQAALERLGVDAAQDGLPPGFRGRIYVSSRAHRTIHRSAAVLGLGRNGVVEIPTDAATRVDVAALEAALERDARDGIVPVAVVAIAGSTDTGAVDPIADVVGVARRFGSWVHVDGAYGLIANASPSLAPLFEGVREADSWIVDPHKWLATGLGVGATYVRDEGVLTRAFAEGTSTYLEGSFSTTRADTPSQFDEMGGLWADQGVELSAPPRGPLVWAVLREIGRAGVARRVERHVGFARRVAERARADDRLELLLEPDLSIACFRYRPTGDGDANQLNFRIVERLRRETPFIPTTTVVDGRLAIRPCFINPRTTAREVEGLVDATIRFGDELTAG
ncbi:MAG TPA: pyridoxal-dependent decarboxylase [Candidatus Eisenbacteria bacterium]|nr:pyridoxal-dependent decarboxylase [Candidatus Eisenbacteria bacterium]